MIESVKIELERKKRRRELMVSLIAALVILGLFFAGSELSRSGGEGPLSGHLLLFGLLAIVMLLMILIIFFLIRNLFKLVFERRGKVLGARIKTRLILAFVALTLVPTVVLFIASASVLHTTIDSWFAAQVEESLRSAVVIGQAYHQKASENVTKAAQRLADELHQRELTTVEHSEQVRSVIASEVPSLGLSIAHVYWSGGRNSLEVKSPNLGDIVVPPVMASFLKIGFQGSSASTVITLDSGEDLVRGIAPIVSGKDNGIQGVVVTDYLIPYTLSSKLFGITKAFDDYQEAKRVKGPVKTTYILILLVVALLVIFVGFWFGMSMAREITDPIQSLALGTQQIATGNLDVFVEPVGDDELSALVRSFNKMASDLRHGRDELLKVNVDLENRRKYIQTVLKNVAAGVIALDADQKVTAFNASSIRLLKINWDLRLGMPLFEQLDPQVAKRLNETIIELRESESGAIERQLTMPFSDKVLTLLCFANILKDESGAELGVVLVFEDLTFLVKAQRMAAWREVARRIAHEIKNPLTPIQLNAQRIRRKYLSSLGVDGNVLDQCTASIIDQVEQLKNMVNEFSKFARMPAANPTPNKLNDIIGEVVALYRAANELLNIRFLADETVPVFDLDREQLKRAVMNLIDNAIAAAGSEGKVEIESRYEPVLRIASVSVCDNGPGINPHDRERIFDPYFTRKQGGTGLGLTIVSAIVADHNGFIRVKDNEDGGACFIFELPVRPR
ncbi:MAG: ATP-binding protein [Deltaproteobacteria bacterium]|nr:ATP-binding protein [Deltaproteobacteria bacterium]